MKFNIINYLIGEGFKNVFKNKKSTISSLIIMCCSLMILGIIYLIGTNIIKMVDNLEKSQTIDVWVEKSATNEEIEKIAEQLKQIEEINSVKFISKEEMKNQAKDMYKGNDPLVALADSFEYQVEYKVTLTDISLYSQVQEKIKGLEKIESVNSSADTIEKMVKIADGIKIGIGILLLIFILSSVFIISNVIKLTVEARKKEIFIMRYVGATNGFIRCPFIVQGIIIGVVSGMISILLTGGCYEVLRKKVLGMGINIFVNVKLAPFGEIFTTLFSGYMILGIGVGVIGSLHSIKKYLKA